MAIIKKIDNKDKVIANKSIVSHEELQNRDAYGAHPISAIRKLPEKLYALKQKDEQLEALIKNHDVEVDQEIDKLKDSDDQLSARIAQVTTKSLNISLEEDAENKGKLVFTDYNGNKSSVQGGFLPDYDTLTLNDENEMVINKVYHDETTLTGSGTSEDPLKIKYVVDENTLIIDTENNYIYATSIKDEKGVITPESIRILESNLTQSDNDINEKIDTVELNINNHLIDIEANIDDVEKSIENINKLDETQSANIADIYLKLASLNSVGGYLPANNFGKNVTQQVLNNYALQEISNIKDVKEIPVGTRVKNTYDGNLWVYTEKLNTNPVECEWLNNGLDTVNIATEDTLGVVKSSIEDYRGNIDVNGIISINGLEEKFDSIESTKLNRLGTGTTTRVITTLPTGIEEAKTISIKDADTIVVRQSSGALYTSTPVEETDAANKKYVDDLNSSSKKYVDEELDSLHDQVDTTITERLEPLEELTSILKTDGQGANYLSDDGTYKEVVTVTSDNQTIVTSEDKVLTTIGVYDQNEDTFKSAHDLIIGTTIIVYEEGEEVV